jgi:charged multivesicular body protein 4
LALQALKRKKRYEAQLQQIDGTLTTLEYQREVLENASSNAEVLKVMSDSSKAFKAANQNMNIDNVHDLMDDISEQQQIASEIGTAISNPVGFDNDIDEDELLKELEDLQDKDVEDELLNIPATPASHLPTPAVASKEKPKPVASRKANDEEEELRKMAEWANS